MFDQPPLYDYILFDKETAFEAFRHRPPEMADAYLSQDLHSELDGIRDALNKGYRWVRTDGEFAIFEKALARPLLQDRPAPAPIHLISGVHHEN